MRTIASRFPRFAAIALHADGAAALRRMDRTAPCCAIPRIRAIVTLTTSKSLIFTEKVQL